MTDDDDIFDVAQPGDDATSSHPFPAAYSGECGGGDTIDEGDLIVMDDGEAWHEDCWERDNEWRMPDDLRHR